MLNYEECAVQARCQALIKSKPSMADLMKLDADAEQLPGIIPEMAALNKYASGFKSESNTQVHTIDIIFITLQRL